MDHAVLETSSDRYVLQEYLAEGGMGAIYLGKKLGVGGFEKEVVLKQLLPEFTSEPQFIDLFLREARISASLDHANIVHTIDLVAAEKDFFIVMEYVRGADLRTVMRRAKRRGRQLSPAAALHIGQEIADALAYAHAKVKPDGRPLGLIHRDVSPSNILLSGSGAVKLTDFGIAKASTHRSVFYRVKGKVGYMSPEQARGEPIDARSDVYSLAVCIFEALTGERLFVADLTSTPSMIYSQPVPRPSQVRPDVPVEVDVVMAKALALRADDRFQNAGELQEALRRVSYRHGLMYSSSEMAAHLAEVCGSDPNQWLRGEVGDERGGGTELYQHAEEELSPVGEEAWDDIPPTTRQKREKSQVSQIREGTQLTSLLTLRRQLAEEEPDEPAPADRTVREPRVEAPPPPPPVEPAPPRPRATPAAFLAPEGRGVAPIGGGPAKWESEQTRHYPGGQPPPDPGEPPADEQTIADLNPPTAALDELRRRRPPAWTEERPATPIVEAAPKGEPTGETIPFKPLARHPDEPTAVAPPSVVTPSAGVALPPPPPVGTPTAVPAAPPPVAPRAEVTAPPRPVEDRARARPRHSPSDPTVVPGKRRAVARDVRTEIVSRATAAAAARRSRRLLVGIAILALLAVGVAIGVALSDPGAEKDDVITAPK